MKKAIVIGWVSEQYETGGRGVGTVSKGWGDNGGVSYGKHQLSSKMGTMQKFLDSEFGKPFTEFKSLVPGTEKFNTVYKQVAVKRKAEFEKAQCDFIKATHYDVQAAKLKEFNLDQRHQAVRECVFSTAVQYGPNTQIILRSGVSPKCSDEEFIRIVQQYKKAKVPVYFKSSSKKVQDHIVDRCEAEMITLLDFLE